MSAPGGICVSCGGELQWCFVGEKMMVRCPRCPDLFGTDVAYEVREGREAVMPDGRPVRNIERIVQDAYSIADCEG